MQLKWNEFEKRAHEKAVETGRWNGRYHRIENRQMGLPVGGWIRRSLSARTKRKARMAEGDK